MKNLHFYTEQINDFGERLTGQIWYDANIQIYYFCCTNFCDDPPAVTHSEPSEAEDSQQQKRSNNYI